MARRPRQIGASCALRLMPDQEQETVLTEFAAAYGNLAGWLDRNIPKDHPADLVALHRGWYESARTEGGLPSQTTTLALKDWAARRRGEATEGVPYDDKLYAARGVDQVSLTTLRGRIQVRCFVAGYTPVAPSPAPARLVRAPQGWELRIGVHDSVLATRTKETAMATEGVVARVGRVMAGMARYRRRDRRGAHRTRQGQGRADARRGAHEAARGGARHPRKAYRHCPQERSRRSGGSRHRPPARHRGAIQSAGAAAGGGGGRDPEARILARRRARQPARSGRPAAGFAACHDGGARRHGHGRERQCHRPRECQGREGAERDRPDHRRAERPGRSECRRLAGSRGVASRQSDQRAACAAEGEAGVTRQACSSQRRVWACFNIW